MGSSGQKIILVPGFTCKTYLYNREIKPVHKSYNPSLYTILCSLPKTVWPSSSESLITTLAGSKGRYYFPILQVRKLRPWAAKGPAHGHSVKSQSCDYQPALQHTELIKGLWKKNSNWNRIGKWWGEISLVRQKAAEGTDLPVGKAKTGSLAWLPKKRTKKQPEFIGVRREKSKKEMRCNLQNT